MKQTGDESRFEIKERLGRGGTAEVFRVRLHDSGREAALKRPLPDANQTVDFARLAAREIALIGGLRFPGLVRILNQPDNSSGYLLLEICEGKTLDQLGQVRDLSLALNLLSAIALDLEYLRQRGIVHGDLKPQNVFLPIDLNGCGADQLFYAKISDFSLGRFDNEPESARAGLGTVGYMAPETVIDGRADHRSDLFALGVIAYQLFTGRHPFMHGESDPVRINGRVREENQTPVNQIMPHLPQPLADIVACLLNKEPGKRPQSALAVCHELRTCGATYPFQQALKPKHLIEKHACFENALAHAGQFTDRQTLELKVITGGNRNRLQAILDINHRLGKAHLTEHGFAISQGIYWPSMLRRQELTGFVKLPPIKKKAAIRAAVTTIPSESALSALLLPLLGPSTIRRIARSAAPTAERENRHEAATQLYLRTGDLIGADRCAYQAASILRGQHRSREAILCINAVLDLAKITDRIAEVRPLLMLKGDIQKEIGEVDAALETYHQIVELYISLPVDKLLAETYRDLGDLYKMKQDSKSGLDALNRALDIYRQMGEELEMSRTYNNIGNSYFYAGDVTNTIRHYRAALRIQRKLSAATETASTLSNLGSVFCMQGNLQRGIFLLEKSLALKKELGDAGEIARTLNNLGYVQSLKGDYDHAMASLKESMEINQRIGRKKEVLYNLDNMAEISVSAGYLQEALDYLDGSLNLARELDAKAHEAAALRWLAIAHTRMGRIAEAEAALVRVGELLEYVDDPLIPAQVKLTTALIRSTIGDLEQAKQLCLETYHHATDKHNKLMAVSALVELVRYSDEVENHETAVRLADELGLKKERQLAITNRVERCLETGHHDEIAALLPILIDALQNGHQNIDSARLYLVVAEASLARRSDQQARSHLETGLRLAQKASLVPESIGCLALLGKLDGLQGNLEGCYAKHRQALQLCKKIADTISSDNDRTFFQNKRIVQSLVLEIRRLGKLLGQKQRAGHPALP